MAIAPPLTLILLAFPGHFGIDRAGLRRKGFVDFHQIELILGPAGLLERFLGSGTTGPCP